MPESACLHIKARETDPVRVVEIPGASVRIGRAPYCEVQLTEPELAEEECLLSRDGGTWHLLPAHADGAVAVEGQSLDEPCVVSFDVPFRVGAHWLTLRPGTPDAPEAAPKSAPARALPESADDRLARVRALQAQRASWNQARVEEKRWEERWKAAGERLKTRAASGAAPKAAPVAPAPPLRPASSVRERPVPPAAVPPRATPKVTRDPLGPQGWGSYTPPPTRRDPRPGLATPTALRPAPEPARPRREVPTTPFEMRSRTVASPTPASLPEPTPEPALEAPAPAIGTELALWAVAPLPVPIEAMPAPEAEAPALEEEIIDVESLALEGGPLALPIPAVGPAPDEAIPARVEDNPWHPVPIDRSAEATVVDRPGQGDELGVPRVPYPEPVREEAVTTPADDSPAPAAPELIETAPIPEPIAPPTGIRLRTPSRRPRGATVRARKTGARRPTVPERPREPLSAAGPEPSAGVIPEPTVAAPSWTIPPTREWPTVQDILAAHRAAPASPAADPARPPRARRPAEPELTPAREPAQWKFPLWLGWLPMVALALAVGPLGVAAAWTWSRSAYAAGQVANRLARQDARLAPLPDALASPPTAWWKTSAGNLMQWVLFQRRLPDEEAAGAAQVREWLDAASQASPAQAQVRLALAQGEATPLYRRLGLSRDVLALAWSGRQLLDAGKKEAARDAYRRALELACRADLARLDRPAFDDSAQVRRYTLPYERLIGPVIRDMAENPRWSVAEWSGALPDSALVRLVAARRLRERGDLAADALLDAIIAQQPARALEGRPDPMHLAAQAEALALKGRWNEAQEHYTRAVEQMPDDLVRRSWWLNLADIALRLDDEARRRRALEVARGSESHDEISRRAVDQLKYLGNREGGARPGRSKS